MYLINMVFCVLVLILIALVGFGVGLVLGSKSQQLRPSQPQNKAYKKQVITGKNESCEESKNRKILANIESYGTTKKQDDIE